MDQMLKKNSSEILRLYIERDIIVACRCRLPILPAVADCQSCPPLPTANLARRCRLPILPAVADLPAFPLRLCKLNFIVNLIVTYHQISPKEH